MGGLDAKLIRRAVLGVMAVLGLGLLTARPGSAVVREPEAVVEGLVGHIIELLESGGLSGEGAIQRLADTIAGDTDLDRLGRLVLGRHWRSASEAQQAEYQDLFRQLMLRKFIGHLGAYASDDLGPADQLFAVTGSRPAGGDDLIVDSTVSPPGRPPLAVAWRLREAENGGWVIIDLIVENVSLLISQRSEFSTVIERGGIEALLAEMRDRLAQAPS